MHNTANIKHCLELVLDTKYWAGVLTISTSVAQLHEKPVRTACLPKYRHAFAAVKKLFSISPTCEWINTDKRCLNVVPELCFDSCRLYCLPLGLSFNYIRLTQCFICHPWLIAERDKFSHGMNRFSFSHCQDPGLASLLLNHSLPIVIVVRKRNGLSKGWAVVQGIGMCLVWHCGPAAKAFLAESVACGIILNPKG